MLTVHFVKYCIHVYVCVYLHDSNAHFSSGSLGSSSSFDVGLIGAYEPPKMVKEQVTLSIEGAIRT